MLNVLVNCMMTSYIYLNFPYMVHAFIILILFIYFLLPFIQFLAFSKRINSTTTFMALNAINEPTTNFIQHRVHNSPLHQATSPRKSWQFTFNNKNFPDGKLSYESHQVPSNERFSWNDVVRSSRESTRQERQDVMARANQIVM